MKQWVKIQIWLCVYLIGEIAIGNKVLKRLEESLTADYTSHALVADILYSQVQKSDFIVQNFKFLNTLALG
jgi:hypothetical protein